MADPKARFVLTASDETRAAFASVGRNLDTVKRNVRSARELLSLIGVAVSGRIFAGWIAGALEVNKLTGEQAAKVESVKTAFTALQKPVGDLTRTIATELAPAIEHAALWWRQFLFPTAGESAQDRIAEINEQVRNLVEGIKQIEAGTHAPGRQTLEQMRAQARALGDEMLRLQAIANKPAEFAPNITQDEWVALESFLYELNQPRPAAKNTLDPGVAVFVEQLQRGAEITESLRTETEKTVDQWREAQELFAAGAIGPDALQRLSDSLLQPIEVTAKRLQAFKAEASQFATDFRMGLAGAFADFIVDGERTFRQFLQNMARELVKSAIFRFLASSATSGGSTGIGKFFGAIFGGGRATGGPADAGTVYRVHPGEAFFAPGTSGQVDSTGGGGLVYAPVTNIDARGAAAGEETKIRALLERNNRQQRAEIADLMRRGRFP